MLIGIRGYKNVGKTKLVEILTTHFVGKGYNVATIKHVHQDGFTLDTPNTDTWRHAQAGAKAVTVASGAETVYLVKEKQEFPDIVGILDKLSDADLVLVEGFKGQDIANIVIGDTESSDKTLAKFDNNSEEIIKLIEEKLAVEKAAKALPGLNCKKCGMTCEELAALILAGEKDNSDCPHYSEEEICLRVNGEEIKLGKFTMDIISKTIEGMVSSLKGVDDDIKSIEIKFSK